MYAWADKKEVKKTTKSKDRVRQKTSGPLYVLRDMEGKEQNRGMDNLSGTGAVLQRYPVEVEGGRLKATPKRPAVPSSIGFLLGMYDEIEENGVNPFEKDFIAAFPDRVKGAYALGHGGKYRSQNKLAFCHKVSIDDIERVLVSGVNANAFPDGLKRYLHLIGMDDALESIRRANTIVEKQRFVNQLILEINSNPANYYLGDASANSSIQAHPDLHCEEDGSATPRSQYIEDNWSGMGISAPKSDDSGWIATSNFGRYW